MYFNLIHRHFPAGKIGKSATNRRIDRIGTECTFLRYLIDENNGVQRTGSEPPTSQRFDSAVQASIGRWLGAVIGLVAPPRCRTACGREGRSLGRIQEPDAAFMPFVPRRRCTGEGKPLSPMRRPGWPVYRSRHGCFRCRRNRFHFETVIRLGVYQSVLRQMCLGQAARCRGVGRRTGRLLWQREETALGHSGRSHHPRFHTIGERTCARKPPYDRRPVAAVLSPPLAGHLATHLLAKIRRTRQTVRCSAERRRTNLKGAFRVPQRFHPDLEGVASYWWMTS